MVALWRAPFGGPGLPSLKGRPRVFATLLRGVSIMSNVVVTAAIFLDHLVA